MASIEKRIQKDNQTITWRVQIRRKGFKEISRNFKTEEEARNWATITEDAMLRQGALPSYTLNQFFDRFEVDVMPGKNQKYVKKEEPYIRFWRQHLGKKIAIEITSEEIENIANTLYSKINKNGVPYSPETRRKYVQTLGMVFNIAIKHWRWAITNPIFGVDLHIQAIKDSQGKYKEKMAFSVKEFKKDFLWVVDGQLERMGLPKHIGLAMMKHCKLSKSNLQQIFDPEANVNIKTLIQFAEAMGISFNAVATSLPEVNHE